MNIPTGSCKCACSVAQAHTREWTAWKAEFWWGNAHRAHEEPDRCLLVLGHALPFRIAVSQGADRISIPELCSRLIPPYSCDCVLFDASSFVVALSELKLRCSIPCACCRPEPLDPLLFIAELVGTLPGRGPILTCRSAAAHRSLSCARQCNRSCFVRGVRLLGL